MPYGFSTVLVINCGSSSIKYAVLAMDRGHLCASGRVEKIGESGSLLSHRANAKRLLNLLSMDYLNNPGIIPALKQ